MNFRRMVCGAAVGIMVAGLAAASPRSPRQAVAVIHAAGDRNGLRYELEVLGRRYHMRLDMTSDELRVTISRPEGHALLSLERRKNGSLRLADSGDNGIRITRTGVIALGSQDFKYFDEPAGTIIEALPGLALPKNVTAPAGKSNTIGGLTGLHYTVERWFPRCCMNSQGTDCDHTVECTPGRCAGSANGEGKRRTKCVMVRE